MLCGREAERAAIAALLEQARGGRSGVLVVRGEPGIGKTALLEDARESAVDMHVLSARGVESESELPFAGLHQLIRPALRLLDRLPRPQSAALQGALGLAQRAGDDRFLISLACLTLLDELAERRPVLCLIDDSQWLDASSVGALLFVARRLDAEGIVMLFGARDGDVRQFDARGLPELQLSGLDGDAAAELIARGAGSVAPSVREALVEQAGGNALALVELPAALSAGQLAGTEPLPETLPLTGDVERLFLARVRRLPEPTQRLLSLVATDDSGSLAAVMRAADAVGIDTDALTAAEQAGLVSVRGSRVEVRHPLVRTAVYQGSTSSERRAAHLALADALHGELEADQRAWHRAAAALGPDPAVADELESTAERARLRSGHAAAAAALHRSAELTVDPDSKGRRLVAAASAAWHAGQPERATALLDRGGPIVSEPRLRAELDHLRGVIEWRCGSLVDACAVLMQGAADVAPVDPRKALEMLFDAGLAAWDAGDYGRVAEAGQRASTLPRSDDGEQDILADLLVGVSALSEGRSPREAPTRLLELLGGDPEARSDAADPAGVRPSLLEVLAHVEDSDEPRLLIWASLGAAVAGDNVTEAALQRRAATLARASGAVDVLTLVLESTAVQGILSGQYTISTEATEGLALAREAGLSNAATLHEACITWLAAVKGREDECRAHATAVAEQARAAGAALAGSLAEWGLAMLDLGAGRPEEAAVRLEAVRTASPGAGHPNIVLWSAADLVEACIRTGREEQARVAFTVLERFAQPGAPTWALAVAARCRALLAGGAAAEPELAEALRLHAEADRPFDLARTALLLGEHLRRQRRRVEAREHLRVALEGFEVLGTEPWAERARAELLATGETARRRDPSTIDQLTPQELQIARLVSEGFSNKEVAAQLFLSPRTIEFHLRNVFSKLGVTSRTQLARLSLDAEPAHAALAGA